MKDLSIRVSSLKNKAEKLVKNYQSIREENMNLNQKMEQLNKELNKKEQQIMELNNKVNLLKISGSVDKESTKDVKLKINELVREIDKCIAQINK